MQYKPTVALGKIELWSSLHSSVVRMLHNHWIMWICNKATKLLVSDKYHTEIEDLKKIGATEYVW